jgi:hypothetical protein
VDEHYASIRRKRTFVELNEKKVTRSMLGHTENKVTRGKNKSSNEINIL